MNIKQLPSGPIDTNCYILWNDQREALVIDPGYDAPTIIRFIEDNNLTVVAYPTTHGHFDHIGALNEVYAKFPAPIGLHPQDIDWCFTHEMNQYLPYYPLPKHPEKIERLWEEGQTWTDAGFEYKIIHTPGHTRGGVCFLFESEGVLVTGDTLFKNSVGRTDLPGGDVRDMTASLKRLKTLADNLQILPGHGEMSTLGAEKLRNPYLSVV